MNPVLLLALPWASVAVLFSAVTLVRLGRRHRPAPPASAALPAVLLLRPLDEPTERELQNLAVPVQYGGGLRHVVLSPYRPRLPPHVDWLYSDPVEPNRKVGHLRYALATLPRPEEVVLAVDADIAVDAALLTALALPVAAGAPLCMAAPGPCGAVGLAARAAQALLAWTHQAFVPLHLMTLGAPALCGKALGLGQKAQALLPGLGHHLGEDLELALQLHANGSQVVLASAPAPMPLGGPLGGRAVVRRFSRWMRVLRAHRPALLPTVPALLCPTPLLLPAALLAGSPWLLGMVCLLWAVRTALAVRLAGPGQRAQAAREWPLGEALLLVSFVHALAGRDVAWRGRRFRLRAGGRLEPTLQPLEEA